MSYQKPHALVVLFLLLVSSSALADTLVVRKWGPPTYRILQEALDAAAPGDTIFIEGGTFSETTTRHQDRKDREAVGWIDKPLTIIGTELAWIDGPDGTENYCLFTDQSCTFEGVQIKDGGGYGMMFWAGTSTVRDCVFEDLGDGIISGNPGTHVSIHDSKFYRCYYSCISATIEATAVVDGCHFEARTGPGGVSRACYVAYDGKLDLSSSEFVRYGMVEIFGPGTADVTDCTARDLRVSAFIAWNGGLIRASRCSLAGGDSIPGPIGMEVTSGGQIVAEACKFDDMTYGALATHYGTIQLHDSEITNSRLYSVLLNAYNSEPTTIFDFTNNWWGTTDSIAIAASIFDGHDDPKENPQGFVEFWPIRDVPLPAKKSSFGSFKSHY